MRVKKARVLLAAVLMGCWLQSLNAADIFADEANGLLVVNNETSADMVLFAGRVERSIALGGIRARSSRSFDIAKIAQLPKNGAFIIRGISAETHTRKGASVSEADVLYSGLVVYDLNNPKDKTYLNIFAGINPAQDTSIFVSNSSKFVLELRLDSPDGEKVATLAPFERNKQVYLAPSPSGMPYTFFPAYVYVDPRANEITTFTADSSEGLRAMPGSGGNIRVMLEFAGPKDTNVKVGFLLLTNQTNESLSFWNGTVSLRSQKGSLTVEAGQSATYELPAFSGTAGQIYPRLSIELGSTKTLSLIPITVKQGAVYVITIISRNGNFAYDIREPEYKYKLEDIRMNLFFE